MKFKDRGDAGKVLAGILSSKFDPRNSLLLAIPNGGIPVALSIKMNLDWNLNFNLLFIRKLQIPYNPEAGFGSITLTGKIFLNERLVSHLQLSKNDLEFSKKNAIRSLTTRAKKYGLKSFTREELHKQTCILVDDGLASGFTMLAAIKSIEEDVNEIIVAVPTASGGAVELIKNNTKTNLICPDIRTGWRFAVAEAYQHWRDILDEEAINLIKEEKVY